MYLIKF